MPVNTNYNPKGLYDFKNVVAISGPNIYFAKKITKNVWGSVIYLHPISLLDNGDELTRDRLDERKLKDIELVCLNGDVKKITLKRDFRPKYDEKRIIKTIVDILK